MTMSTAPPPHLALGHHPLDEGLFLRELSLQFVELFLQLVDGQAGLGEAHC